jgi:hypothetical protein
VQNVVFYFCTPNALVEAFEATVKMIRAVVFRQLVLDSVQSESTLRDTIRVTSNQSAEVTRIARVIFKRPETKDDIAENAVAIRRRRKS